MELEHETEETEETKVDLDSFAEGCKPVLTGLVMTNILHDYMTVTLITLTVTGVIYQLTESETEEQEVKFG